MCYFVLQKKNALLQIVTFKGSLLSFEKKTLRVWTESVFITLIYGYEAPRRKPPMGQNRWGDDGTSRGYSDQSE